MSPASTYIAVWCLAVLAGLALGAVTIRLFLTMADRRESPLDPRYLTAFVGYPCLIVYFAVKEVGRALTSPRSFLMIDLLIPAGALLLAGLLALAEWRYVASSSQ